MNEVKYISKPYNANWQTFLYFWMDFWAFINGFCAIKGTLEVLILVDLRSYLALASQFMSKQIFYYLWAIITRQKIVIVPVIKDYSK